MKGWPASFSSSWPTMRETMSPEPPGPNGTTMRTGLAGQTSAARAAEAKGRAPSSARAFLRFMSAAETADCFPSMQVIKARGETEFRRLDQLRAADPDAVQLALEVLVPEIEELAQLGEAGGQVQVLPDVALQHVPMIGHPVENLGGRDAVVLELRYETTIHQSRSLTPGAFRNSHASLTTNQQNSFHINGLAANLFDCC